MQTNKNKIIIGAVIVALVLGYLTYRHFAQTPEQKAAARTAELMVQASRHIILPSNEVPTIFEIKDPSMLAKQQIFFANAQQGDELLIFSQAGKAIIYSPRRDVIVNVGPITADAATTSAVKK